MKVTVAPESMEKTVRDNNGDEVTNQADLMGPFPKWMKRCTFVGFPLKTEGLIVTPLCSKTYLKYWPIVSYLLLIVLGQIVQTLVYVISSLTTEKVTKNAQEKGRNITNEVAYFSIFIPQIFGVIKQSITLLNVPNHWNSLNVQLARFLSKGNT